MKAKARAAQIAFSHDLEATCDGPGSFAGLCHSLIGDLLAIREETANV